MADGSPNTTYASPKPLAGGEAVLGEGAANPPVRSHHVPILGITADDVLTQNKTRNMHHRELHSRQQYLKDLTLTSLIAAKTPQHLGQVIVTLHYAPETRHRRDADGIAASLKPCLDAAVARHVITDDSSAYVVETRQRIEPVRPKAALWLTITQVDQQEAA